MSITLILVVVTSLVSLYGFSSNKVIDDFIFYPPAIKNGQWYRFITHGLIHLDVSHLLFNMLALYSFGQLLEQIFVISFGTNGKIYYLVLYISALIISSIPDYITFKNSNYYRSLGASGAVSAVIFSCILFEPKIPISIYFLPGIPGYIFAILYLIISTYLAKKGKDNIGHRAHISGAVYGLLFTIILTKVVLHYNLIEEFIHKIRFN